MAKDEKLQFCMSLFGFITFLSFVLPVLSESSKNTWTSCTDGYGLNYTLPMFERCKVKPDRNGSMVQTIPKVIPFPSVVAGCHRRKAQGDIPAGYRICRIPDCGKNLCKNGWCEETFTGFTCHCSTGFQGEHCDEVSTKTATQQATTKSTGPTTTIPVQGTATSQDPTPSESTESATTEATTKPKKSPTTKKSKQPETTTSREATTSDSPESATTTTTTASTTNRKTSSATKKRVQPEMTTPQDTTTPEPTESQTTGATSKPTTSPTNTKLEQPETTTSQDTTTPEPTESQTTKAKTKPKTSPLTTKSHQPETTTSQDTTTSEVRKDGSCYYFSTSEMDHDSALSNCSEHNSHLVYIETEEEQDFIEDHVRGSDVDYWIGLKGRSQADATWLDGSRLTYNNTKEYSFNDGGKCFRIRSGDYTWHDRQCSKEHGYICEQEIGDKD